MKPVHLMLCLAMVAVVATGCSSVTRVEPMSVGVVMGDGQPIVINQIVILADSSGSMASVRDRSKFPTEKSLLEAFVSGMPEGSYGAGLVGFGDHSWVEQPLSAFDRGTLAAQAAGLPYMGGLTPMDDGINRANAQMRGTSGRTAILIFSDGRPTSEIAAFSAAHDLVNRYQDVCIYTVQIGDEPDGTEFLRSLSEITQCGAFRTYQEISTAEGMRDLICQIFFGGPCGQPEPPKVEPPKQPEPGPCPDQDGDGVCDDKDECPDTPKGAHVDERGCWVIGEVLFDYDKAFIREEYHNLLDEVADVLQQNPDIHVRIDGHTDSIASVQYNQRLSERRAQSVYEYLVRRGVDAGRLSTQGFGETKPVAPNDTPENRQRNRRTEFTVVK